MRRTRRRHRTHLVAVGTVGLAAALFAATRTGLPPDPSTVSIDLAGHQQRLRPVPPTGGHRAPSTSSTPAWSTSRPTAKRPTARPATTPAATATSTATSSTAVRPTSAPTSPAAAGSDLPGWKLTWSEEFSGGSGTAPSTQRWEYDLGGEPQWGNQEWQYYTDRTQNVSLDGAGHLAITARQEQLAGMAGCQYGSCDITSGRITTHQRFAQRYGRFEASIKIPQGAGTWPAFWMLGDDVDTVGWPASGEIDVMEAVGNDPLSVFGTAHATGFPENGIGNDGYQLPSRAALAADYHRYAIEWSPERIDWFLDDQRYFTVQRAALSGTQQWAFGHPFFMLLNLAIGGEWAGNPTAATFPATMSIDYVRVYTGA